MARTRGCYGLLKVGPTPTTVGELEDWTLDESANVKEIHTKGNCSTQREVMTTDWQVTASGYLDSGDAGQALIVIGDTIAVELAPEGTTTGSPKWTGNAIVSALQSGSPGADLNSFSCTLMGDGALTKSGTY